MISHRQHMHLIWASSRFSIDWRTNAISAIVKWDLKALLFGLLLLSFADAVFTDIGLRFFLIDELNPIVKRIYEWNIVSYYAMKLLLPMLLIVIYYFTKNRKWINPCILLTVVLYFFVNIYHLIWISLGVQGGWLSFNPLA